jgi:hypothetical protein
MTARPNSPTTQPTKSAMQAHELVKSGFDSGGVYADEKRGDVFHHVLFTRQSSVNINVKFEGLQMYRDTYFKTTVKQLVKKNMLVSATLYTGGSNPDFRRNIIYNRFGEKKQKRRLMKKQRRRLVKKQRRRLMKKQMSQCLGDKFAVFDDRKTFRMPMCRTVPPAALKKLTIINLDTQNARLGWIGNNTIKQLHIHWLATAGLPLLACRCWLAIATTSTIGPRSPNFNEAFVFVGPHAGKRIVSIVMHSRHCKQSAINHEC